MRPYNISHSSGSNSSMLDTDSHSGGSNSSMLDTEIGHSKPLEYPLNPANANERYNNVHNDDSRPTSQLQCFQPNPCAHSNNRTSKKNSREEKWLLMFDELKQFKAREGHCMVPVKYRDNPALGTWANSQRVSYRHYLLCIKPTFDAERERLLEELGFKLNSYQPSSVHYRGTPQSNDVVKNPNSNSLSIPEVRVEIPRVDLKNIRAVKWQQMFEKLKLFKARKGHCMVPVKFPEDQQLGTWINTQRKAYKTYRTGQKKTQMTDERFHALESIGFVWKATFNGGMKPDNEKWNVKFEELKSFKKLYGHTLVPQRYKENPQLGQWVHIQRIRYKHTIGNPEMMNDRVLALKEIGFVWRERDRVDRAGIDNHKWLTSYYQLCRFKAKHAHCKVPSTMIKLSNWVTMQRQEYTKYLDGKPSVISTNRRIALEKVGFITEWFNEDFSANLSKESEPQNKRTARIIVSKIA